MPELRKDYLLERWVLVNEQRAKRPEDFKKPAQTSDNSNCPFCPGHEAMTPLEISRIPPFAKEWRMRVFPNKFPAVMSTDGALVRKKGLLKSQEALGAHEVIVHTPSHTLQLWDLPVEDYVQAIKLFQQRIKALQVLPYVEFVAIFHNSGRDAGASLEHCHSQIVAINHMPTEIKQYLAAYNKLKASFKHCPVCETIKLEKKSERLIAENASAVAIAPFASRFNFEVTVFPKKHKKSIIQLNEAEIRDFAELLHSTISRLKILQAPFHILFTYSPKEDFHFFATIAPRTSLWAGFEIESGIIINIVSPERAAKFYRGENI